ncbi:MAG: methyltransferase family protein [Promethearchaeota archaeon]
MTEKTHSHEREIPHSHLYQLSMPIIFFMIWILDTFIFKLTTWLNEIVISWIRMPLFIIVLVMAVIFIYLSHESIFKESHEASDTLLTDGILGHVRNPLYLGIMLIYVSFIMLSMSIISMIAFIFVFLVYNKMADFEAGILEDMFGDDYLTYKSKVHKWIPSVKKRF